MLSIDGLSISKEYLRKNSFLSDIAEEYDEVSLIENLDVKLRDVLNYINYLQMKDFAVDEKFRLILDYDTADGKFECSDEYFKMWAINQYDRNIYEAPKQEINCICKKEIFEFIDNFSPYFVIAGGSIYGDIQVSDIDIFICGIDEKEANKLIEDFIKRFTETYRLLKVFYTDNAITLHFEQVIGTDCCVFQQGFISFTIQFIKILFKTREEIVYNFDIPCCSFLYKDEKIYGTKFAIWTEENKILYLEPNRICDRYIKRLVKYSYRDYIIKLPEITVDDINIRKLICQLSIFKGEFNPAFKPTTDLHEMLFISVFVDFNKHFMFVRHFDTGPYELFSQKHNSGDLLTLQTTKRYIMTGKSICHTEKFDVELMNIFPWSTGFKKIIGVEHVKDWYAKSKYYISKSNH